MDIAHFLDFDFQFTKLGTFRIGSLPNDLWKSLTKEVESTVVNANGIAAKVLLHSAYNKTGVESVDRLCGGPPISAEEVQDVTADELNQFAEAYGARFFGKQDGKKPIEGQPTGADFLTFQIRETNRLARERHEKLAQEAKRAVRIGQVDSFALAALFKEQQQYEKLRSLVAPMDEVRKLLGDDWHQQLGLISNHHAAQNAIDFLKDSSIAAQMAKQYHDSVRWMTAVESAREAYSQANIYDSFAKMQKSFHQIQRQWELPQYLVDSVGALSALQEQIGKLTLPTIGWDSAAALAAFLGPEGLQAQLAELGIDESGNWRDLAPPRDDSGYLTNKQRDLLTIISLLFSLWVFMYQEASSNKWQAEVDGKLSSQSSMVEKNTKQLEALSHLLERAVAAELKNTSTRFVVRDRPVLIFSQPRSGAAAEGRLLPREVATLESEEGKWIQIRYYHWGHKDYKTGWALKKYFSRVPASRQADD